MRLTNCRLRSGVLFILCLFLTSTHAQNKLFYAGNAGAEVFHDVVQLSDGSVLIAGAADGLDWVPPSVPRIDLGAGDIANNLGANRYAFLLHTDSTFSQLKGLVHLAQGAAEDIRFIKLTNAPQARTGQIYLSGTTEDSSEGGYFLARLNGNFVDRIPTGFDWTYNVKCVSGDYPKQYQPWDVDAEGRVYFVRGDSHDFNWSSLHRLDENGVLDVVENWRTHWKVAGGEYRNTPASAFPDGGAAGLSHSGIVFKKDGRCNLRSWTQADYERVVADGNGGTARGPWPLDALFASPCAPQASTQSTDGPGYTGYQLPSGTLTYGPSSVVVDRRNGHCYIGFNTRSILPNGNPDFEPAVLAMDATGTLRWWSRLYHEVRADGSTWNSSPDQYVDGLAIDYSRPLPAGGIVVMARCHGNNNENFWEGNTVASQPAARGFQNRFTGTNGNIHISWLGKLTADQGTLIHSTYVAEYADHPGNPGAPHPDPLLDAWPDPNQGWPQLNTTRLRPNALKVTADGSVIVIGRGRRTMTTRNAHQKMPRPGEGGSSTWNYFVRQYDPSLSRPLYSSLVVGQWDTLSQQSSDNTDLYNVFKLRKGLVVVGSHRGERGELPVANVPLWGGGSYDGISAVLAYFEAAEIRNDADAPVGGGSTTGAVPSPPMVPLQIHPNPTRDRLFVQTEAVVQQVQLCDMMGRTVRTERAAEISLADLPRGIYLLEVDLGEAGKQAYKVVRE